MIIRILEKETITTKAKTEAVANKNIKTSSSNH